VNFMVCPKHRQSFGIGWRGRKKNCQVPVSVASHRFKKHTGDRAVNKDLSEKIFHLTGLVIPIGSGIPCVSGRGCRLQNSTLG
jgi:hypothetical protein